MISTPYGFCPLPPMNAMPPVKSRSGYAFQPTDDAVREAFAACPEGFTLMPAAEVYKEYPDLQQKKYNFDSYNFEPPDVSKEVAPPEFVPANPMLESFIPGGRGTSVSATD